MFKWNIAHLKLVDPSIDKIRVVGVNIIPCMFLMNYVLNLYVACECLNLLGCCNRNTSKGMLVGLKSVKP